MKKKILLLFFLMIIPTRVWGKNLYDELMEHATLDNERSEYVASPSGINFKESSGNTNGRGLYIIGETINKEYPIVYFRGDVENNYIIYQNFCWQMVRTTSTGGIKIMYAGIPHNNMCLNEKEALTIGKSSYNDKNQVPKYGWTYQENEQEASSLAKQFLDDWYEENLLGMEEELEDTIWCNDRRMKNNDFIAKERLEAGNPTLSCEQADSYTVSNETGNQKLKYPVGIITGDELVYAGEVLKEETPNTYVNIFYSYWSMTPYAPNKMMYPNSKGMLNRYTFTYQAGIRPMISLKTNSIVVSGLGTRMSPFIVQAKEEDSNPETLAR